MRRNKRMERSIITMLFAVVLFTAAACPADEVIAAASGVTVAHNATAGIVTSLLQAENSALDQAMLSDVAVEKAQAQLVTATFSEATAEEASEEANSAATIVSDSAISGSAIEETDATTSEDEKAAKLEKEWQDKVMADVKDSLSVRAKADADSKLVGKLYPTSVATVIDQGKRWTKIKSGDVKGYVKTSYLIFGMDAYENANKVCKTYAYVQTDGLRVRSKAKKSAKVLTVADKGDRLLLDKDAKEVEGWVAVSVKAGDGYVAADYVKVKLGTTDAISIEEIEEQQKKAAAAAYAEKNVSSSDETLLAAIIYCEAGSECYEGQVAVGAVVMNRVHNASFPSTISGVIYQRGQFGPVTNGSLARTLSSGNIPNSCKQAAAAALAGSDPTGGKLSFHRANGRAGVVIGNHVFF